VKSPRLLVAAPLLLAAGFGLACLTWEPWSRDQSLPDPAEVRASGAVRLQPGDSKAGDLDCKAGRCDQWFRLDVARSGVLRVEVGVSGLADRAIARLFLQDGSGKTLVKVLSTEGLPLRVEWPVEPGPYAVLVEAGGGPVLYSLETALE
jgi:hypothetical protein